MPLKHAAAAAKLVPSIAKIMFYRRKSASYMPAIISRNNIVV